MTELSVATPGNLSTTVPQALMHPLPGSSAVNIRSSAAHLAQTAGVLRTALTSVRTLSRDQSFWIGAAATDFAKLVERAPKHIDAVAERYEGYAGELRAYAACVERIHGQLRARRAALHTAWSAYRSAQARLPSAGCAAVALPSAGRSGRPIPADAPTVTAASIDQHLAEVLTRHRRVCASYADWEGAARAAARALHAVDGHNALQNPQGLHAVVNNVSSWAGDLSTVAAISGLVALAVCPVLAPVLFAAATAAATTKAVADVDRKLAYDEDVSGFDFADDALGMVPGSGFVKAGAHGVTAAGQVAARGAPAAHGAVAFATHLAGEAAGGYAGASASVRAVAGGAVFRPGSYVSPVRPRELVGRFSGQAENLVMTAAGLPHVQFGTAQAFDSARTAAVSAAHGGAGPSLLARTRWGGRTGGVEVILPAAAGSSRRIRVLVPPGDLPPVSAPAGR